MNPLSVVRGLKSSPAPSRPPSQSITANAQIKLSGVTGTSAFTSDPQLSPTSQNATAIVEHCVRTIKLDVRCFAAFDKEVYCGERDGSISVWNSKNVQKQRKLPKRADCVWALCIVHKRYLWTACGDGDICIYDLQGESIFRKTQAHPGGVYCLEYDSSADIVWSGGADWSLKMWDPKAMEAKKTYFDHTNSVRCMAIVSEGRIWTGSDDSIIRCWNNSVEECEARLSGHQTSVTSMCFVAAKEIWSGSEDGFIRMWDSKKRNLLRQSNWHKGRINSIAVAGIHIWTASSDKNLCIWSMDSTQPLSVISEHSVYIRTLVRAGWQMWSASGDKSMKIWASEGIYEDLLQNMGGKGNFEEELRMHQKKLADLTEDMQLQEKKHSDVCSDYEQRLKFTTDQVMRIEDTNTQLSQEIAQQKRLLQQADLDLKTRDSFISEQKKQLGQLDSMSADIASLKNDRTVAEGQISKLAADNESLLKRCTVLESQLLDSEQNLKESGLQIRRLQDLNADLSAAADQNLGSITSAREKMESEEKKWSSEMAKAATRVQELEDRLKAAQESLNNEKIQSAQLNAEQLELKRRIDESNSDAVERKKVIDNLEKTISGLREALSSKESQSDGYQRELEDKVRDLQQQITNRDSEIDRAASQILDLSTNLDITQQELRQLKQYAQSKDQNIGESEKLIQDLRKQILQLEANVNTLQKEKSKSILKTQELGAQLQTSQSESTTLQAKLDEAMKKINSLSLDLDQARKDRKDGDDQLVLEKKSTLAVIEDMKKEIQRMEEEKRKSSEEVASHRSQIQELQNLAEELKKRGEIAEETMWKMKEDAKTKSEKSDADIADKDKTITDLRAVIEEMRKNWESAANNRDEYVKKSSAMDARVLQLEEELLKSHEIAKALSEAKTAADKKFSDLWEEVRAGRSLAESRQKAHDEKVATLCQEKDYLTKENEELQKEILSLKSECTKRGQEGADAEDLRTTIDTLARSCNELRFANKELELENQKLQTSHKRLEEILVGQNSETELLLSRASELENEITDAVAKKAEAEMTMQQIKDEFSEFHAKYEELYRQYEILVSENKAFEEECYVLREKTKKRTADSISLQKKCEQYEAHIQQADQERRALFEKWEARIQQLDQKRKEEAAELTKEIETLRKELDSTTSTKQDGPQGREALRQLRVENEAYSRKLREADERVAKAEKQIQKLEAEIEALSAQLAAMKQSKPLSGRERFGGFV